MLKNCKAAIFDMDGTLLDSMMVWDRMIERFVESYNVTLTPEDIAAIESRTLMECAQYYTSRFPELQMTPQQMWDNLDVLTQQRYRELAKPKPGIISFLKHLKASGVKLGVATLTTRVHSQAALEFLDMMQYFDVFLTVDEAGAPKTQPDIYLQVAQMLGSTPAQSIVFEDAPYAGETAKRAGFQVCGVSEKAYEAGQEQLRAISDYYVRHSFDELLLHFDP